MDFPSVGQFSVKKTYIFMKYASVGQLLRAGHAPRVVMAVTKWDALEKGH